SEQRGEQEHPQERPFHTCKNCIWEGPADLRPKAAFAPIGKPPPMRSVVLAILFLLAAPGAAFAAGPSVVPREVPLHGERTLAAAQPERFNLVGLHWQGSGRVFFRTHAVSGRWSRWRPAAPEAEDRPDSGSRELAHRGWQIGNPYWTGTADRLQVRTRGRVTRVRAHYVWSPVEELPVRSVTRAGSPPIFPPLAW